MFRILKLETGIIRSRCKLKPDACFFFPQIPFCVEKTYTNKLSAHRKKLNHELGLRSTFSTNVGKRNESKKLSKRRKTPQRYHDLKALSKRMTSMMKKKDEIVLKEYTKPSNSFFRDLFLDTRILVVDLCRSVEKNIIKASGNDIHIISSICADALHILSLLPPGLINANEGKEENVGAFDTCIQILETVYDLGMDVTPNHIASAISIACKEEKYFEAANLFRSLYNVDTALSPMDPTLGKNKPLELGLFAMAKVAQQETFDIAEMKRNYVAETVLQAAHEMGMISPRDNETYILGAIAALGKAGEWEACVDFWYTDEGKNIGQPLLAGVMNACLESDKGSVALQLYEKQFLKNEELFSLSEWQTGGEFENILPSCRNAALCAFRSIASSIHPSPNQSNHFPNTTQAINILNKAIEAKTQLTEAAMESVLFTCMQEKDLERVCALMDLLIDENLTRNKHSDGENSILSSAKSFFGSSKDTEKPLVPFITSDMLSSVMQVCNFHEHYALSIYYLYTAYFSANVKVEGTYTRKETGTILTSMLETDDEINEKLELALRGLGLQDVANELNNATSKINEKKEFQESKQKPITNDFSSFLDLFALENILYQSNLLNKLDTVEKVAHIMKNCSQMGQPMMGLIIARRVANTLEEKSTGISAIPPSLRDRKNDPISEPDYLFSTDAILGATIEAYYKLGWDMNYFLYILMESMDSSERLRWPISIHEILPVLVDIGQIEIACITFNEIDSVALSPQSFLQLARSLVEVEEWSGIQDLWNSAKEINCISEELGIFAIKATSHFPYENEGKKFPIIGDIVWNLAQLTGLTKSSWKKSRYWILKEVMLQRDIVKLMGWKKGEIKEGEYMIALNDYYEAKSRGEKIKNEILYALVRKAGYHQRHVRCRGNPIPDRKEPELYEKQCVERNEGVQSIFEILAEARKSTYGDDPLFTLQVAQGLRALKAEYETVEFVKELVVRDVEIRPKTFLQAVFAAKSMKDVVSRNEIIKMMEDSGFTYSSHEDTFRQRY